MPKIGNEDRQELLPCKVKPSVFAEITFRIYRKR